MKTSTYAWTYAEYKPRTQHMSNKSHTVAISLLSHYSRCWECVGYSDISQVNLPVLAQVSAVILDSSVLSTVSCTCPVICPLSDWQAGCYSA